jgi:shikimate dehydrogenase
MYQFQQGQFDGMNVTAPLKSAVLPFIPTLAPECSVIGAANLLLKEGDTVVACNYDHVGVSVALAEAGVRLHGAVCLLLGAGGAGRAAAYALLKAGATLLWANRTLSRVPTSFNEYPITPVPLERAAHHLPTCDVIINTLPKAIPNTQKFRFHPYQTVFDASYSIHPLQEQALRAGARYIRGERWLLHQAIPSFTAMTGVAPDVQAIEEVLCTLLAKNLENYEHDR